MTKATDPRNHLPAFPRPVPEDQPLLRVLLAEAIRRRHTLKELATQLGVNYERIGQWRRREASISTARRPVLEAAARYLEISTVQVFCLTGQIRLEDMTTSAANSATAKLQRDLHKLTQDSRLLGLVPDELMFADAAVQRFVLLLHNQMRPDDIDNARALEWLLNIQLAAIGVRDAEARIRALQEDTEA